MYQEATGSVMPLQPRTACIDCMHADHLITGRDDHCTKCTMDGRYRAFPAPNFTSGVTGRLPSSWGLVESFRGGIVEGIARSPAPRLCTVATTTMHLSGTIMRL